MVELTIFIAFTAGLFSFLSPCVLPLIPAFLTFLANVSLASLNEAKKSDQDRLRIFLSSIFFVLGFSFIFSLLGVLFQSVLSGIAYDLQAYLGYIGGAIIIAFGLMLLGILEIPFLQQEHKIRVDKSGNIYVASFIFGAAFAVGWTPCVGAALGSILTLAVVQPGTAFPLMLSYSLGLGIPFILCGIFVSQASSFIKKLGPYLKWFNLLFGLIMIGLGILVFTGTLNLVANLGFLNDILLK
ncbi:cytochrome C biogenesis protein [Candidatus Micrarchaeota archaeon]|nr:cytochrome C biogenesis protein [Candidatus Micrarchaeota archaeon]